MLYSRCYAISQIYIDRLSICQILIRAKNRIILIDWPAISNFKIGWLTITRQLLIIRWPTEFFKRFLCECSLCYSVDISCLYCAILFVGLSFVRNSMFRFFLLLIQHDLRLCLIQHFSPFRPNSRQQTLQSICRISATASDHLERGHLVLLRLPFSPSVLDILSGSSLRTDLYPAAVHLF